MKLNKNLKYGASALALALLLSACSGENANQAKEDAKNAASNAKIAVSEEIASTKDKIEDKKEQKQEEKAADAQVNGLENKEFKVSLDDAVNKFKEAFAEDGIEVEYVEFDQESAKYVYDIKGFKENKEFEATIDAESGEIISQEQDTDDSNDKKAIDLSKIISPSEAIKKALENNQGYAKSWEIDYNDLGKMVYEIDVENGDDVELDAENGDIIQK